MKRLAALMFAAILLLNTLPALAMQPVDSPDYYPSVQSGAAGGKDAHYVCGYRPPHQALLEKTTTTTWLDWIEKLSGAELVRVGSVNRTISNRHSFALFNRTETDYAISYGFDYLEQTVRAWEPKVQVEVQSYSPGGSFYMYTWKNLIVTIPGTKRPDEMVMMTAHFDSTNGPAGSKPLASATAPGADDNASGSATLLEAARILKDSPLERTVRLVWFTGEEQGLYGSGAYVQNYDLSNVVGVINLDMYAYDSDSDRCFELHISRDGYSTPESEVSSERIGACFTSVIDAYNLDLKYDFLVGLGTPASDHRNFWLRGIGAIEVGENFYSTSTPGGCGDQGDMSRFYHSGGDTVQTLNASTGFAIHRAALGTLFSMATLPEHQLYFPGLLKQDTE